MEVYAYAFLKTPPVELELPLGINQLVQLVPGTEICAVVEFDVDINRLQGDDALLVQAIVAHDRTLGELFEQQCLLPLRFGTLFLSLQALQEHLVTREAEYLEKLDRLVDKGEYILKCIPRPEPESEISTEVRGKAYLLAKKQRYQATQAFQNEQSAQWDWIRRQVTELYPEAIASDLEDQSHRIFLLASIQEEPLLYERFQEWQQTCSAWELQLGEALPPYHFV
ncbi:GvpL/GvpF family gas vesicle protein [Phormidium pseudopriestleyi FRX01]|uniref:GvpL/GvpF family gas vesicle protein n=1 Tax=Phormidium pseudopriestleyi FRX01 TaxID=1759528 RepID=A0ABS3FWQ2_9CYAN|nr:GvpL/GvpF family gas vesicle protein [Phormidium pseudopriestleyi]MBO0351272.1 GvpL/GvpF family gas vesicle protein [Phormidium pseudopriestleyi FRX01]